jgi:hypothetical protein
VATTEGVSPDRGARRGRGQARPASRDDAERAGDTHGDGVGRIRSASGRSRRSASGRTDALSGALSFCNYTRPAYLPMYLTNIRRHLLLQAHMSSDVIRSNRLPSSADRGASLSLYKARSPHLSGVQTSTHPRPGQHSPAPRSATRFLKLPWLSLPCLCPASSWARR